MLFTKPASFLTIIVSCTLLSLSCTVKRATPRETPQKSTVEQNDSSETETAELEDMLRDATDQESIPGEIPNFQLYNSSGSKLTLTLDDKEMNVAPQARIARRLETGNHKVETNNATIDFHLGEKEKVLINPLLDSIIMEEVLYTLTNGLYIDDAKPKHYKTPIQIITLGDEQYAGPYKLLVNEKVIKGWDFALNEESPRTIKPESPLFKGFNTSSYFKISTTSELKKHAASLNHNNKWIATNMQGNISELTPGYTLTVEQDYLVVELPNSTKISVAKVSINKLDKLELREINFYNKTEHGKITTQVAILSDCFIKEGKSLSKKKVAIVMSDNTHQPHIRILK